MARLGFRTLNEMIGRVDRLDMRKALDHWKAGGVDLSQAAATRRRRATAWRSGTASARTTASTRRSTTS